MKEIKFSLKLLKVFSVLVFFSTKLLAQDSSYYIYVFNSAKEISFDLSCAVELVNNNYEYRFSINCLPKSEQDITRFMVEVISSVLLISSPDGWRGGHYSTAKETVNWSTTDSTLRIQPGETLNGFKFSSIGVPIISNSFSRGYVYNPPAIDEPEIVIGNNIFENCVIKRTLAPKTIPIPFEPLAFIDSMIEMGDEADALGWLGSQSGDDKIWFDLKSRLREIQKLIKLKNYSDAIFYLEDFISNVDHYHFSIAELISSEGYALLFFNGKYLLDYVKDLEDFWGLKEKWNIRK